MSKYFFKQLLRPTNLLICLIFIYIIYHLFFSNGGLFTYLELKKQRKANELSLSQLNQNYDELSIEVDALNPQNPSADIMDEQVKIKLSFVKPDEILLIKDTE